LVEALAQAAIIRYWTEVAAEAVETPKAAAEANEAAKASVAKIMASANEADEAVKARKASSFESFWVRQAIVREIVDQMRAIRVPAHLVEAVHRLVQAQEGLAQELGREPTSEPTTEPTTEVATARGAAFGSSPIGPKDRSAPPFVE
jgi:hypothetical protein